MGFLLTHVLVNSEKQISVVLGLSNMKLKVAPIDSKGHLSTWDMTFLKAFSEKHSWIVSEFKFCEKTVGGTFFIQIFSERKVL